LKFFCLNIDNSDHTAVGAAKAVAKSLARLGLSIGEDTVLELLVGDSGGGAAVFRLHAELMIINVMAQYSRHVRCLMHAINKAFEMACLDAFGAQGINIRSMTQLFWLVIKMFVQIKEQGGLPLLDCYYTKAFEMLRNNGEWQLEGLAKFKPAMLNLFKAVNEEFDVDTDEGRKAKEDFLSCAPRNITCPNLGRWTSLSKTGPLIKCFYPIIYFIGVTVIQAQDAQSYLRIIAAEVVSTMVTQPNLWTEDEIADENTDLEALYKPGDTPPMYALTVWFCAFCDSGFNDNFNWLMRNDPALGIGSFGQVARLCPERAYIMHKMHSDLEDGKWRDMPIFRDFIELLPGVRSAGEIMHGGREFVERVPEQFLETYRFFLEKHTLQPWRSSKLVILLIGGNNILSKHFLRRIFDPNYRFPNEEVILYDHTVNNGFVTVNIRDCLDYLLEDHAVDNIDESELYNDHLIQDELEHWLFYATSAPMEVDLMDKSTWSGGDEEKAHYEALHTLIRQKVVPLPHDQQRIEAYIRMAGLVSQTGVGEARATWRGILQSTIMCPINEKILEFVNREADSDHLDEESEGRATTKKVCRVKGRLFLQLFSEYADEFLDKCKCDVAIESLGSERMKTIETELKSKANKASADGLAAEMERIDKTIGARRRILKAANKTGIDVPAAVGGQVFLQYIAKTHMKDECQTILRAELKARGIEYPDDEWDDLEWAKKKLRLKQHEASQRVNPQIADNQRQNGEITLSKITSVKPWSQELKDFLLVQKSIHCKEKQLDDLESMNYVA
jgi:hypothetical protein